MRLSLKLIGLGSLLLVSCGPLQVGSTAQAPDNQTPDNQTSDNPAAIPDDVGSDDSAVSGLMPVQTLVPSPIQISLEALPEPYASESARKSPDVIAPPEDATLNVPAGFTVNVFASGLDRPRWLALTPDGDVLVTETRENRIRRLADEDGDGVAEVRETFATAQNGLDIPFGMAFSADAFFLGNSDEVRRFDWQAGETALAGQGEQILQLPGGGYNQHWTRNVVMAPEGDRLFVSIGSRSNVDEEPLPRAAVQTVALDGRNPQVFASGLRNPVGLDFHPVTGEPYVTVNERDGLGDDLVPDYFTQIREGEFFGWPYAYLSPENLDPRRLTRAGVSEAPEKVDEVRSPDVLFQAHSAALGLQFYEGDTFPQKYRNGAFVAFRGSWNRSEGTGYKIVFVPFDTAGRPTGGYEDFLTGFLVDPSGPTTWGRPVGLLVLPDGSLLLTEEANGRIYRIQYQG